MEALVFLEILGLIPVEVDTKFYCCRNLLTNVKTITINNYFYTQIHTRTHTRTHTHTRAHTHKRIHTDTFIISNNKAIPYSYTHDTKPRTTQQHFFTITLHVKLDPGSFPTDDLHFLRNDQYCHLL